MLRFHTVPVNSSQKSGRYFTYLNWFILMDTDEQLDADVHRVKSGRVPGTCPCGAEVCHSPSRLTNPEAALDVIAQECSYISFSKPPLPGGHWEGLKVSTLQSLGEQPYLEFI